MSYGGQCEWCFRRVEVQDAAYPVSGFEVARHGGGPNQIRHRRREPNRILHATPCMDAAVRDPEEWARRRADGRGPESLTSS